jgi:hypothetical protein
MVQFAAAGCRFPAGSRYIPTQGDADILRTSNPQKKAYTSEKSIRDRILSGARAGIYCTGQRLEQSAFAAFRGW